MKKSPLLATALILALCGPSAFALSLNEYLEQVKASNPQVKALVEQRNALKERGNEGALATTPEFFTNLQLVDDRTPPLIPGFQPSRTKAEGYQLGLRGQFAFGLSSSLSFEKNSVHLDGLNGGMFSIENPYTDTIAKLELKQSLWRNGFGEKTRADRDQISLASQSQYEAVDYQLRQLLLQAENAYWGLSSFNEIIDLQKANVDNARKTNSWMKGRVKQRLFDDVDGLQTQAALETRELEYQSSLDEKGSLERELKKYLNTDRLPENLDSISGYTRPIPASAQDLEGDGMFSAQKLQQKSQKAQATSMRSQLRPQLDLVTSIASTGRDPEFNDSLKELNEAKQTTWMVSLQFSAPIDFSFLHKLRKGYDRQIKASEENLSAIDYELLKTKEDLLAQARDAKERLEKARRIEKISEQIVKKERILFRNGRTTTYQMLNTEQDFASAQIQRVRAQLAFIQLNNTLRLFSEEL
jgi:outer membrane protein TolC